MSFTLKIVIQFSLVYVGGCMVHEFRMEPSVIASGKMTYKDLILNCEFNNYIDP